MKNIYFIVLALMVIFCIIYSIRNNKLSVTNSFIWIVFCLILLFLSIFPKSLDWLADFVDVYYPPTLFLTIAVVILFIINFQYSKKIEDLQKKVVDLGQELSIVKGDKKDSKNGK